MISGRLSQSASRKSDAEVVSLTSGCADPDRDQRERDRVDRVAEERDPVELELVARPSPQRAGRAAHRQRSLIRAGEEDPGRRADAVHGALGDGPRLARRRVARIARDLARVGRELVVPLAHRPEELDHRLGDRGLERAVLPARELGFGLPRRSTPVADRVERQQVRDAGLLRRVEADFGAGVRHRGLHLLGDRLGVVEHADRPLGRVGRLRHLRLGPLQVLDARADRRDRGLRDDEGVAEAVVEAAGDVAGELEVLGLVLADRDLVGVVQEDVGRHEDRVVEQAGADRLLLAALLLELGHPPELADGGDAVEDPGELGDERHVALHEEDAPLRVEAGGQEQHGQPAALGAQLVGLVGERHRVEVDHAVDRRRPGPDRPPSAARRRRSCRGASRPTAGCRRRRESSAGEVIGPFRRPGVRVHGRGTTALVTWSGNGLRGEHPRLPGAVRPAAAPDPQGRGGALGGVPGPRSSTPSSRSWSASTASTSTSPPSSCSSRRRSSS